ncbi:MAG: GNAT family N-acetyltransferase [Thermodesulfobacteriota bacterium]
MARLIPLDWDSQLLGVSCARLETDEKRVQGAESFAAATAEVFERTETEGLRPGLTFAKILPRDFDPDLIAAAMPGHRCVTLGQELTFRRAQGSHDAVVNGVAFALATEGGTDPEPFLPLAGEMRHSRFYLDPGIGEERARRVWQTSIEEHCRGLAQEIAVAELDGRPAGLATVHLADDTARLHIVGVLGWARGRGVGARLMQAVIARHGGDRTLSVEAFAANEAACALYEKAGFTPAIRREIVHFWLRG